MADRPVGFDEPTARRLLGLLRDRRNDPQPLRQEVPSVPQTARRHRWAKATTNYLAPTYPTSGNVVLVEFGEYQFTPPTSVNQTVSPTWVPYTTNPYDPGGFAFAVVPTGGTLPTDGDVVRVDLDDGVWWVRPTSSGTTWPVVSCLLGMDYIMGGGGYVEYNKPGGWYVYDSYGNTSEIGFTPNNSRSVYTDWTFSLSAAGWYLWLLDWFPTNAYISGTAAKTYTTSGPSAGAAHTHTVDVDRSYRLYGETWLERQAGGSGAWDYGVPSSEITAGMWERRIGYTWHSPQGGYSDGHDGSHNSSGSWSERAITANDRFRLTTWVWPDAWSVADGVTHKANNEMLAQLTIVRIGDNPS